jgi:hypothetical protein
MPSVPNITESQMPNDEHSTGYYLANVSRWLIKITDGFGIDCDGAALSSFG